jgi:AcrR family transcriptional regulator
LADAREVFLGRGYTAVTIATIAQAAGVVVETIYRAFGGKAALFKAVVEAAVAGGAEHWPSSSNTIARRRVGGTSAVGRRWAPERGPCLRYRSVLRVNNV